MCHSISLSRALDCTGRHRVDRHMNCHGWQTALTCSSICQARSLSQHPPCSSHRNGCWISWEWHASSLGAPSTLLMSSYDDRTLGVWTRNTVICKHAGRQLAAGWVDWDSLKHYTLYGGLHSKRTHGGPSNLVPVDWGIAQRLKATRTQDVQRG